MPGFYVYFCHHTIRYRPDFLLACPGHQEDISELLTVTRDLVLERVKGGEAWVFANTQAGRGS